MQSESDWQPEDGPSRDDATPSMANRAVGFIASNLKAAAGITSKTMNNVSYKTYVPCQSKSDSKVAYYNLPRHQRRRENKP